MRRTVSSLRFHCSASSTGVKWRSNKREPWPSSRICRIVSSFAAVAITLNPYTPKTRTLAASASKISGQGGMRERPFLRLWFAENKRLAGGFSVTLNSPTKRFLPFCVLESFCAEPCILGAVFAGASTLADCAPLSVSSAFTRAPNARFISPRESNRTEHGPALVTAFPRENSVLHEEFSTLFGGQDHACLCLRMLLRRCFFAFRGARPASSWNMFRA